MKNSKVFIAVLIVLVLVTVLDETFAANVEFTDINEVKTSITDFKTHLHENCESALTYIGVPTKTDFSWEILFVSTSNYRVHIPFDIIQQVTKTGEADYTILLSDKTVIEGKLVGVTHLGRTSFEGEADLGSFSTSLNTVKELLFRHEPMTSFEAVPQNENVATLTLSDDTQIQLKGIGFVEQTENKNGCYIGATYKSTIPFTTGSVKYDISLDKLAGIEFMHDMEAKDANLIALGVKKVNFKVISKATKEYVGSTDKLIMGIGGVTQIGNFELEVIVPFTSTAKKISF